MPHSRQMHPYLMGAPSLQLQPQKGPAPAAGQSAIMGHRHLPLRAANPLDDAVRMPGNGQINCPRRQRHFPLYDSHIAPMKKLASISLCQGILQLRLLCHQYQPGGIAVKAVHRMKINLLPRPAIIMQQPVAQGVVIVAAGRMHQHTGRLVEDNHVLVLIPDIQRHRRSCQAGAFRNPASNHIPVPYHSCGSPDFLTVDQQGAVPFQPPPQAVGKTAFLPKKSPDRYRGQSFFS